MRGGADESWSHQISTNLGSCACVDERESVGPSVCIGVTCLAFDGATRSSSVLKRFVRMRARFSPVPATPRADASTEMSLLRNSSMISLSTTASYAGVGSTEFCFRLRRASA